MAKTGLQPKECPSDDDSISITSTASSEKVEQYVIRCILAEKEESGQTLYLVAWDGYTEDRHTWEPEENFDSDETFKIWKEKQMGVTRYLDTPFDVEAWEERVRNFNKVNALRKARRRAKRRRQGFQIESSDRDLQSEEDLPIRPKKTVRRKSTTSRRASDSSSSDDDEENPSIAPRGLPWTTEELRTLEVGLQRLGGPLWTAILELFGPTGTENQALKDRTRLELQAKAFEIKNRFIDSGQDPPQYFKAVLNSQTTKFEDRSRIKSKKMLEKESQEILNKEKASRENDGKERGSLNTRRPSEILIPQQNQKTQVQHSDDRREAETTQLHQKDKYAGTANRKASKQKPTIHTAPRPQGSRSRPSSTQQTLVSAKIPRDDWGKDLNTTKVSRPAAVQMGAIGSGPARNAASKNKYGYIRPRPNTAGISMTSDSAVKQMSSKRKTDADGGTRFKNLSTQNRIFKRSRNEPAPNIDNLTFIDPKTGKVPKSLPTPVAAILSPTTAAPESANEAAVAPAKTPFQQIQDRIAATRQVKEARERRFESIFLPDDGAEQTASSRKTRNDLRIDTDLDDNSASKQSARTPSTSVPSTSVPSMTTTLNQSPPHSAPLSTHPINTPSDTRREPIDEASNIPRRPREVGRVAFSLPTKSTRRGEAGALPSGSTRIQPPPSPFHPPPTQSKHIPDSNPPPSNHTSVNDPLQADLATLTLMANPTSQQKADLFGGFINNIVLGTMYRGFNAKELGRVKLAGLDHDQKRAVMVNTRTSSGQNDFHFSQMCTAMEYESFFHRDQDEVDIIASGYVIPYHQSEKSVENLTKTLAAHTSGGMCFCKDFTMLIWPASSTFWGFLERDLNPVPEGTILRFALRRPLAPELSEKGQLVFNGYERNHPDLYKQAVEYVRNNPVKPKEKAINVVMRDLYNIEYSRYIANNDPSVDTKNDTFFLCFVPVTQEIWDKDPESRLRNRERMSAEHGMLVEFLQANGAKGIYSMQNIGSIEIEKNSAWHYFRQNVINGCMIFHEDFVRHDMLPGLAKLLRRGSINAFKFDTKPMITDSEWSHSVRVFPHGCCFMMTDSLFLRKPHEALRILRWFRLVQRPSKTPGTWKVAMRIHPMAWIIRMMDDFEAHQGAYPGVYQLYADICSEIAYMLYCRPGGPGTPLTLVRKGTFDVPLAKAAVICPYSIDKLDQSVGWKGGVKTNTDVDPEDIAKNDDILVEWFAETSTTRFEEFRKFQVVIGYDKGDKKGDEQAKAWTNKYGHIEVLTPSDFTAAHSVTPSPALLQLEQTRQQRVRDSLPQIHADRLAAKRDTLELTAALIRDDLHRSRKQAWTDKEEDHIQATKDFMRKLGRSQEEIERLACIDYEGIIGEKAGVVEPPAQGEWVWTRGLSRLGFEVGESAGGGTEGVDVEMEG